MACHIPTAVFLTPLYTLLINPGESVPDPELEPGFVNEPEYIGTKVYKKYQKDRDKALVLLAFYWDNLWD